MKLCETLGWEVRKADSADAAIFGFLFLMQDWVGKAGKRNANKGFWFYHVLSCFPAIRISVILCASWSHGSQMPFLNIFQTSPLWLSMAHKKELSLRCHVGAAALSGSNVPLRCLHSRSQKTPATGDHR